METSPKVGKRALVETKKYLFKKTEKISPISER
jgi:hypothetical protein